MHSSIRNLLFLATFLLPQTTFLQSATAAPISKWGELKFPPGSALPGGRVGHTAIYDPVRNMMVVYGGVAYFSSGGYSVQDLKGDVWTQSFGKKSQWTERITSGGPPPRYAHSAIYDRAGDRMVIFGGMGDGGIHLKDVWALSLSDFTWNQVITVGTPPFQRVNHSAIYDEAGDRMIVFGGLHGGDSQTGDTFLFFSDVWALQFGDTNTWQEIHPSGASPGFRMLHLAAYVAASNWMVVAGDAALGQGKSATMEARTTCGPYLWVRIRSGSTWHPTTTPLWRHMD